jgi:hypothetical protein
MVYSYNVYKKFSEFTGPQCGPTERLSSGAFPYTNDPSVPGRPDFTLTGPGLADDLVPLSLCDDFPTDRNGNSRVGGPTCDAGSVERITTPAPTCPGGTLTLTKIAEDATTVTFRWAAVPGVAGYRFSSTASSRRPNTWDVTRTTVRFAKGATCYRVEALGVIADGGAAG